MTEPPAPDAQPLIPVLHYSSAGQRPQDRYAEWREGSLLAFGRMYDTAPVEPFAVDTGLAQLGAIGFAHSRMSAQRWHRTREHIRADDADPLMVAVRFAGHGDGDADGRQVTAPPGSIVLSDFSRPFAHDSETAFTGVLRIPRALAEQALPAVRSLHGLVLPPREAALLREHVRALIAALEAGMPVAQAARLGRVALDLLAVGIAQVLPWDGLALTAAATAARRTAEAAIERHLASRALTIENLCRWTGVSRATLYRLFEAEGGVRAYVDARRLAHVADELRSGRRGSLADLAERWGYSDARQLSRQFRARHGMAPGDFRARHAER